MNQRPNFIIMNCDDLGYGDISCYGSKKANTPTIDKMAAEGIKFTDFYMAASVCSPSRAAMLTGTYPLRIGFDTVMRPGDPIGLNPDEITIANILQKVGYATSLVGKWHLGDQHEFLPLNFGFDSYYGLPYSNDMGVQSENYQNPPLPVLENENVVELQPNQSDITDRYLERAIEFINKNKDS